MLWVENFPEGVGAVVNHRSPVGFDLRHRLLAQAALQQGDNVMMAQVRGIHGNGGRLLLQAAHQRLPLPGGANLRQYQPDLRRP